MTAANPLLASPLLTRLAPYTVAGYALFRRIIEVEGALPARIKGLFAAVAATTKRDAALAARELSRARTQGLTLDEASSGLILLSSLRGEGVALAYDALLCSVFDDRLSTTSAAAEAVHAEPGEAEANFRAYFGTVPPALANLLGLVPIGADAYYLMRKGTIECNRLDRKLSELMLVAVLAADYSPMAATHVKAARAVGATEHELAEAILCAVPSGGIAAWMAVGTLLEVA